jgi:hypothetical protein
MSNISKPLSSIGWDPAVANCHDCRSLLKQAAPATGGASGMEAQIENKVEQVRRCFAVKNAILQPADRRAWYPLMMVSQQTDPCLSAHEA